MRLCDKCGNPLPFTLVIDGRRRNLASRRFCLSCSPFKAHNTRDITKSRSAGRVLPKRCIRCGRKPPAVSFYRTNGLRYCKACANHLKWMRDVDLKKKAIQYKGGRCLRCGYTGHYAAFQFHHLRDKEMTWNMMRNTGWERVRTELDKCQLLCANCHQIIHTKPMHQ